MMEVWLSGRMGECPIGDRAVDGLDHGRQPQMGDTRRLLEGHLELRVGFFEFQLSGGRYLSGRSLTGAVCVETV